MALTSQRAVEAALLRPLTDVEAGYIGELIAQVESSLRSKLPAVDERIDEYDLSPRPRSAIDPQRVSAKLAAVLKRYMVNPEGAASKSSSEGPFSDSISFAYRGRSMTQAPSGSSGSPGELEVTEDDVTDLLGAKVTTPRTIHLRRSQMRGYGRFGPRFDSRFG